jgi:hypothetical protein
MKASWDTSGNLDAGQSTALVLPVDLGGPALDGIARFAAQQVHFTISGPGEIALTAPPPPACGGDGQSVCQSGYCATGFGQSARDHLCHPCGQPGQVVCTDGVSDPCAPGLDYDLVNGDTVCRVCGGDGQPYCETTGTCSSGLTTGNDNLCHPCGGQDQPACSGDTTCASGLWVNPAGQCEPCGQEGQYECEKGCAAGLTGDASGLCHAS